MYKGKELVYGGEGKANVCPPLSKGGKCVLLSPGWWLATRSGEIQTVESRLAWQGARGKGWGRGIGPKEPSSLILPPCLSALETEQGHTEGTVGMAVFMVGEFLGWLM